MCSNRAKAANVESSLGPRCAVKGMNREASAAQVSSTVEGNVNAKQNCCSRNHHQAADLMKPAEWLGDTENICLLLTAPSLVLRIKVMENEEEKSTGSLLVIVLPAVLSLALCSSFHLFICSCYKFLALLVRPFTCTSLPKGYKPYSGLTFCHWASGGHNWRA